MTDNGHLDARTIHARLTHPVIDADGHWLEYGPVMREEFRRIGGEAAVEGLALASQRVPNALRMTVAERTRRRIGRGDRCRIRRRQRLRRGVGDVPGFPHFLRDDRRGTLAPERLASDSPIAMACLRLVTFLPERPERSWPRFLSCIARSTFSPALRP